LPHLSSEEMPHLKKIILLLLVIPGMLSAQRDAGDTLLIKRPQYLGIFIGRLQYAGPEHDLYRSDPVAILGIDQVLKLTVGNAIHGGIFFTYPFLHRMEWDMGFGVLSFERHKVRAKVTNISPSTGDIISMHTWNDNKNLIVAEFRSHFSVIVSEREKYSFLVGAGGWLASQRMEPYLNPGSVGVEGNFTVYYNYNKKSFAQVHVSPGWMRNGYYVNVTLGICYQGMRTMRAHPKHYYVRTYDQEE
jgi:hypothetical protein